jgi:hypothetical protein
VETNADTETENEDTAVPTDGEDPAVSEPNGEESQPTKGCSGVVVADVVCVMLLTAACALTVIKRKEETC